MFFKPKCLYCGGKNIYLKRTSPIYVYGCKACEKKVKYLKEQGMEKSQIKKLFKM